MFRKRLKQKVRDWCDKTYTRKLAVTFNKDHAPSHNHRCHINADHMIKAGHAVAVAEVVMIDSDSCTLHYINLDANGDYFDCTLGYQWSGDDYRLIRLLNQFPAYPGDHLCDEKRRICKEALGRFGKMHDALDLL